MRRKEKQIYDKELINSILNAAHICRIAMCKDNIPYVVPMNFGFDGEDIYLHSAKKGRKIDILEENSHVCFELELNTEIVKSDSACGWTMKFYSLIGYGKAVFVDDDVEKRKALDVIMRKYSNEKELIYNDKAVERVAIIKIKIEELIGKKSGY